MARERAQQSPTLGRQDEDWTGDQDTIAAGLQSEGDLNFCS